MKKRYLIIGSLAFMQFMANAQASRDSTKYKPNKTEIELVYNHYIQDGNKSAVTGGIGTEQLTVYGPALNLENSFGKNTLTFNLGADIISSASLDNIDFVKSSASKVSRRGYLIGNYSRQFEKQNLNINGGLGLSIESAYFSVSSNLGFTKSDKDKLRTYSAQLLIFNDDLRWGRLSAQYWRPVKLIYPVELRYKEWYDVFKRNSYNLKLGLTQIVNTRNTLAIFPEFSYQQGLLATPYHRIYFSDGTEAVEQLPKERYKGALALRLNTFVGGNVIFKNTIDGYTDNFGIEAFSFENETALKLKHFLTLLPNFRIYTQKGSRYFAPYKEHKTTETYYTSDYDLSSFQTYNIGIGFKYSPQEYLTKRFLFNDLIIRYNYLHRTNNLNAHIISLIIQTTKFKR
jgi:hypothetical protein